MRNATRSTRYPLAPGRLDRRLKDFQRVALLGHVVMPVVVPGLNASQAVRLKMTSHFSTNSMGRKERLDTGADALQLETVDRVADDITSPARQRPHADGLLACGR